MFGTKDLKSEIRSMTRESVRTERDTLRIGPWELYSTPEGYLAAMNVNTLEEVILAFTSTPVGTLEGEVKNKAE